MQNNPSKLTLTEIFDSIGGDKGSHFTHVGQTENLAHNYTKVYDEVMSPFRDEPINLLEIGLWCPYFPGASVKAWNLYFSKANYFGVDIVDCRQMSKERVSIDILDQKSELMIQKYLQDKPKFKFVIDDGCHQEDAIIISLGNLFPQVESGGIYFIEDLHVVNKLNLRKLLDKKLSSSYISKDKIDYINNNVESCNFDCGEKMLIIHKK